MSNSILSTTQGFLNGIQNNLYNNYNMYSYAYLKKASDGSFSVENDSEPAVESLSSFPVPANPSLSLNANGEGPYIGTTGGKYFSLTDCSGFVTYILAQTNAEALAELNANATTGTSYHDQWRSAAQFANYAGGTHWTQVLGVNNKVDFRLIQPGDIIAWDEAQQNNDTGHVMIAMAAPTAAQEGVELKICDSSILAHKDDQRSSGIKKGNDYTGVGTGVIGLMTDKYGNLFSNFFPGNDQWVKHPHINILRLNS